ncbi:MAG: DUF3341 domain-containing protein [Gemmataceae bacterium]|nr:DUF3341 domain-containing protein [Gemmataceae bacterium]
MKPRTAIHGVMAEFATPQAILLAARRARQEGYQKMDAYTPYAVEGLSDELGLRRTRVPFVVLMAALVGAGVGFWMQYYTMAVNYPLNVGGRPHNSWPAFIPITFEVMVLVSGFAALIGMLLLNGLPQPYHPVFNLPRFLEASQDRFFLCIEATDPQFDRERTRQFLASLNPDRVMEVPHYEDAVREAALAPAGDGRDERAPT